MNILYVSKLDGEYWQGPTHSVPNQVKAQEKYDSVIWVNINGDNNLEWSTVKSYTYSNLCQKFSLTRLDPPFNKPDLVIFEGVYEYPFYKICFDCLKYKVPYIIIPRSALTKEAQKKKRIKKRIANGLFFKYFVKNASAIQFLTVAEKENSISFRNRNSVIIPNGIELSGEKRMFTQSNEPLKVIYIGRLEIFQKGLDLLIDSLANIKTELEINHIQIHLYGPDREHSLVKINDMIQANGLERFIFIHNGIYGKEKEKILLSSDAFIMTSRFEGLPMGLIEALSYGIPCLITKGTNMVTAVNEYDAGWFAENDIDSIVSMLKRFIKEIDSLETKGANARALAKNYCWDEIGLSSHNYYQEIIGHNE